MHLIQEFDRGMVGYGDVYGGTWHNMPQYRVVDGPVPLAEAYGVVDYPVEKHPVLMRMRDGSVETVPGKFILARVDTPEWIPLHTCVGNQFESVDNTRLLRFVEEALLSKYPDITVDTVGTLGNGKHAFVSLNLGLSNVRRDPSDTVGKLMYVNRYGDGAIPAVAHTVRVVCWNTLNNALASARATGEMRKFRHTGSVYGRMSEYLVELAGIKYQMEKRRERMELLSQIPLDSGKADLVLADVIPLPEKHTERQERSVLKRRGRILERWETDEDLQGAIKRSAYSMVQAVIAYADHDMRTAGSDSAYVYMDGVWGSRDAFKQKALAAVEAVA